MPAYLGRNERLTLARCMVSLRQRISFHEAGHATAALVYNIPIIAVSIDADVPHLHRGHYRAPANFGLERLVTMCLAGPAAERYFVGPITDGGDQPDIQMARGYLSQRFDPLTVGAEIVRLRDAADRLVRTLWVQDRIRWIAAALLRHGTLTGDEIGVMIVADA